MNEKDKCICNAAPKLIFACSGAADVGGLADQAARKLTREGKGKMYCLAGIGGRVAGILATTESAAKIVAIDGCPVNCAKLTLEQGGFSRFEHLCLQDMGFEKGKSPVTPENVEKAAQKVALLLA